MEEDIQDIRSRIDAIEAVVLALSFGNKIGIDKDGRPTAYPTIYDTDRFNDAALRSKAQ